MSEVPSFAISRHEFLLSVYSRSSRVQGWGMVSLVSLQRFLRRRGNDQAQVRPQEPEEGRSDLSAPARDQVVWRAHSVPWKVVHLVNASNRPVRMTFACRNLSRWQLDKLTRYLLHWSSIYIIVLNLYLLYIIFTTW